MEYGRVRQADVGRDVLEPDGLRPAPDETPLGGLQDLPPGLLGGPAPPAGGASAAHGIY
jgi:hypothetical protein